jgi:hypothetical protein
VWRPLDLALRDVGIVKENSHQHASRTPTQLLGFSGSMLTLPTFSFYAAWTLLLGLFACAYVQGAEFASTKETATVFGCVIGLAAFFSWLAVEDDDEDDEDDEDVGDERSVGDGATAKQKAS